MIKHLDNPMIGWEHLDKSKSDLKEKLSDVAHQSWSSWMVYLFSKSTKNDDGTVTIPKDQVDRWTRQMKTKYADLTEAEKDSDRVEANKMMKVI